MYASASLKTRTFIQGMFGGIITYSEIQNWIVTIQATLLHLSQTLSFE